jgi:iron complex outermembrane receptor protein
MMRALNRTQFDTDATVAPSALQFDTRKSSARRWASSTSNVSARQMLHVAVAAARAASRSSFHQRHRTVQPRRARGCRRPAQPLAGAEARWTLATTLGDRPLTLVAGAAWDRLASQRRGYRNYTATASGVIGELRRDEENRLYDFDQYLQASWDMSARWSTLLGLRHSDVHFDSTDHYITTLNPDDSGGTRYQAWTPAASLLLFGAAGPEPVRELQRLRHADLRQPRLPLRRHLGLSLGLKAARTANAEVGAKWRHGTRCTPASGCSSRHATRSR